MGNKKAEAMPLLAPGTTREPGPRLRERSCRVSVKEIDVFHISAGDIIRPWGRCQIDSEAGSASALRAFDPGATVIVENARGSCRTFSLEGLDMGDSRRTAERNAGAFLSPDLGSGGGIVPVPMDLAPGTGPGKPGPEDEWVMPVGPEEEPGAGAKAGVPGAAEPDTAPAAHGSELLHRLTHRG